MRGLYVWAKPVLLQARHTNMMWVSHKRIPASTLDETPQYFRPPPPASRPHLHTEKLCCYVKFKDPWWRVFFFCCCCWFVLQQSFVRWAAANSFIGGELFKWKVVFSKNHLALVVCVHMCGGAFACVCVWYFLLEKEQSFEKPSDDSLSLQWRL